MFDELANRLNLGKVINVKKLTGGLMHKMYKVETEIGVYAIKVLNPEVIKRKEAYGSFIRAEKICNYVKENGIPVSNALTFNDDFLIESNDIFYIIFEFVEGKTLKNNEITEIHCEKIGKILAKIHNLDFTPLNLEINNIDDNYSVNWNYLLDMALQQNIDYLSIFKKEVDNLYVLLEKGIASLNKINNYKTLCHRDMDSKNVMWNNDNPIIIDWESADLSNPNMELLEIAICWSNLLEEDFSESKFLSLVNSYKKERKVESINWEEVIIANLVGRIGWLEYNLKRSLGIISSDQEEMKLALNEVNKTFREINSYVDKIDYLNRMLSVKVKMS